MGEKEWSSGDVIDEWARRAGEWMEVELGKRKAERVREEMRKKGVKVEEVEESGVKCPFECEFGEVVWNVGGRYVVKSEGGGFIRFVSEEEAKALRKRGRKYVGKE